MTLIAGVIGTETLPTGLVASAPNDRLFVSLQFERGSPPGVFYLSSDVALVVTSITDDRVEGQLRLGGKEEINLFNIRNKAVVKGEATFTAVRDDKAIEKPECAANKSAETATLEIGESFPKQTTSNIGANETLARLKRNCATEWQDDFKMQEYCINRHVAAAGRLAELFKSKGGIPADRFDRIGLKCAGDWKDDYAVTLHCVEEQVAAWKRLNGGVEEI